MTNEKGTQSHHGTLKNAELLQGQSDNRTIPERLAEGKKEETKRPDENWIDQAKRTTNDSQPTFYQKLKESREKFASEKNVSKEEPEKDK